MATIDDVIDVQSETNDLLRQLINNIGTGTIGGTGTTGTGSTASSRSRRSGGSIDTTRDREILNFDPNESELERHYKRLDALEKARKEIEGTREEYEELLKLQEDGVELTDEQLERLEELRKKQVEYNNAYAAANRTSTFKIMTKDAGGLINSIKTLYGGIRQLTDPWAKADAAASKYAKTVAMSAKGMENLRKDTINNIAGNNLAIKYNTSTEELLAAQENYIKASGRNIRVSNADQENIAAMESVAKGRGVEMAALMDNFGVSVSDTADRLGKMFSEASKEGISFEKYSDNVAKNIKMAQNYTFKNGLKGLESMAKKATTMKMDMQQVAALADNVSTVEGSIDVASKLQVLGGSFAQLADPLGMLNEGLNDMEGLQDRLIKMVGGLGTFNQETGEVQVSSFNKQRVKAAAKAMGISYDSLMESANAQARRGEIEKQIESNDNAKGLSNEMKELIKNSGSFKDGKAGVSIRGQFKSLDQLTEADKEAIQKESQTESEDIKDIAYNTRSLVDIQQGREKQTAAFQAKLIENTGTGNAMKNIESYLGESGWFHAVLTAIQAAVIIGQTMNAASSAFDMGRDIYDFAKRRGRRFTRRRAGRTPNRMGGSTRSRFSNMFKKAPAGTRYNSAGRLIDVKTGRYVSTKGVKAAGGAANRIANSAGSSIIKGSAGRTAKRALIKTVGKAGATKALGVGAKLAAGATKGFGLGIIGAAGDIITDSLVAKGKMEKGGVGHHIGKGLSGAASGAALGMTIGSVIPGIGTAIGGVIGAIGGAAVGLFKAGTAKEQKKIEDRLKGTGITMKGDYGRGKLEKINHALKTGYIDERLRKKLEKEGDHDLLAQIDKKAEQQRAKGIEPQKMAFHEGIWGKMAKYGAFGPMGMAIGWGNKFLTSKEGKLATSRLKRKIYNSGLGKMYRKITKNDKVKKTLSNVGIGALAAINPAAAVGLSLYKKNKEKKNRIKLASGKTAKEILDGYQSPIKPIPEKGTNSTYGGVDKTNKDIHLKTDPQNINFNGTLNLKGANGQLIDISKELKDNPVMRRNIAGMLSEEMSIIQKGGNFVQRQ